MTVPVAVYPTAEAKKDKFTTLLNGALPEGTQPENYVQFKGQNNTNVNKPEDGVTVAWGTELSTTEQTDATGNNTKGSVKVTYSVTNADGTEGSVEKTIDINLKVYHATPTTTHVTTTFGTDFGGTSNNAQTYFTSNSPRTSSAWKSTSNGTFSEYASYSRTSERQKANYLGKYKDGIQVFMAGDNDNAINWNRSEKFDVTFEVKPLTPTVEGATSGATSLTVNNVNSGTTVELYDMSNPAQPNKIGETTVAKEGEFNKKDKINVPLLAGKTLNPDTKIIAKVVYISGTDRTESDNSTPVVVKSMADVYRNKVLYPVNTDKVIYNDSDINNGNFTDVAKDRFAAKIEEVNANNRNLPTGVTYIKGNTNDKTRVVVVNFSDGSHIDISHTQVAKPTVPTITPTETEGHKADKIADSDRVISGTALNSATKVTLIFQDGKRVDITDTTRNPDTLQPGESVIKNGKWTYKMPDGKYLRQTDQTAVPGSSPLPFKATQTVFDAVSDEAQIYVAKERTVEGRTITAKLGDSSLQGYINDPRTAVIYKERGKEVTPFPSDFEARWDGAKPTLNAVGTFTHKVKFYEKDGTEASNRISEGVDVKFIIRANSPAELTATQKQNGTTIINIPTDADEVTFSISKGSGPATKVVAKKSENWSLSNGLLAKSPDNTWKFGSHEDGTYTITAVATAGNGETKSDETTTVITSNSHKVTKADIIKKPTDSWNGTDLYSATGVTGVIDNGVTKTYQAARITSVTSDGALPTLTPDSETQVPVVITYNDGSKENTTVTLKVAPAAPNVTVQPQNATTGDVTLTIRRHNDTNYPDDSVVTVPGIDGTFKVKDGTITIKNSQLKDTVQTGKVTVTEGTKLPAETDGDKVIPAKKVASAVPTLTQEGDRKANGDVDYKVTKPGGDAYPQNSKVSLNGHEYTVGAGGIITVPNAHLPETATNQKATATETDHFPTEGTSEVALPAKKVASAVPTGPTGDGQQGPAMPSADTNRRPDTATPAEVPATQPAEQPSQTVEVPAQLPNEVSETDSSVSQPQAVLPNTGTQEERATGALGLLSLLGAFGLLFATKKTDDEEEV